MALAESKFWLITGEIYHVFQRNQQTTKDVKYSTLGITANFGHVPLFRYNGK